VASIRARIVLWYAGVIALILGCFAFGSYVYLSRTLAERTDEFLAETIGAVAGALEFERAEGKTFDELVPDVVDEFRLRDIEIAVLERDSKQISAPSYPEPRRPRARRARLGPEVSQFDSLLAATTGTETMFRTVPDTSGDMVRLAALPYRLGARSLVIGAARSLNGTTQVLREARIGLTVGIPLMLLIATAGGNLMARQSLAPLAAMTRRAARIGARSLHERLPIANAHDELGRLATVFNDLLGRLDQSFEEQRRFMADASHELRTPVAIMSGESELALARGDRSPDELRDALATIRDEGKRLKRIVDDLFLLARANAGEQPLRREELYLDEVVGECVRAARSLAEEKHLSLRFTGGVDLPFEGDEALLRRLLMNLVDNAIKYTPSGGEVAVGAERRNGEYVVTVSDTGPGIPPEAQPHIFDRFFRANRDRRNEGVVTGGAGLGLAIAKWVAESHGGRLTLVRSDEAGSVFEAGFQAREVTHEQPVEA
jgi:two-component system OmpR family sensor kinase